MLPRSTAGVCVPVPVPVPCGSASSTAAACAFPRGGGPRTTGNGAHPGTGCLPLPQRTRGSARGGGRALCMEWGSSCAWGGQLCLGQGEGRSAWGGGAAVHGGQLCRGQEEGALPGEGGQLCRGRGSTGRGCLPSTASPTAGGKGCQFGSQQVALLGKKAPAFSLTLLFAEA